MLERTFTSRTGYRRRTFGDDASSLISSIPFMDQVNASASVPQNSGDSFFSNLVSSITSWIPSMSPQTAPEPSPVVAAAQTAAQAKGAAAAATTIAVTPEPPLYKQPWFWMSIAGGAVVLGGVSYAIFRK
jgi:hypothetical protein